MELVFATHNPNKLNEVQLLLPPGISLISLEDISCTEEIPETSDTLEGNALQKANYVYQQYGRPCFADDTGLLCPALGGAPGVYSARYAGPQKNAADNIARLLLELNDKTDRIARFETVIALVTANKQQLFRGIIEGEIIQENRGAGGFGYDPVFVPKGHSKTFAELPISFKNQISHRAIAFKHLMEYLSNHRS